MNLSFFNIFILRHKRAQIDRAAPADDSLKFQIVKTKNCLINYHDRISISRNKYIEKIKI